MHIRYKLENQIHFFLYIYLPILALMFYKITAKAQAKKTPLLPNICL